MNTKTALLIIIVLLLFGLIFFLWGNNARVERQLVLAEQNTTQAQGQLIQAGQAVQVKSQELARVREESQTAIEETEAKIDKLKKETSVSLGKINKLTADNQALKEHITKLSNPEVELVPQPIEEVLISGIELYPQRNLSGAEIQANGKGLNLFQLMIEEIQTRRVLDPNNENIINEQQDQNARLAAVIREHETRFLALGKENAALGETITALDAENLQCNAWAQTLQKQVDLHKQKYRLGLPEKAGITAGLALAVLYVWRELKK